MTPPDPDRVVTAGVLYAGDGSPPVRDGAVLVRGDRIVAAGPVAEVRSQARAGTDVRDFPGGALLPGLIDAHVHLAFDGEMDAVGTLAATDDATLLLQMAARARTLLASGITTVRDLGDRGGLAARLRDGVAAGLVPGPRILTAGTPVTPTGGHCWFLGGEADGETELRRVVRRVVRDGADVVKVMATGGTMTPASPAMWTPQFSVAELRVVVEEARRYGRPVAAHAHGPDGIAAAVEAGVDTVEHGGWVTASGVADRRPAVAARMRAQGTAVCPTVGGCLFRAPYDAYRDYNVEGLRWWREQDVTVVAGTDAGSSGTYFGEYARTLPLWLRAGYAVEELVTVLTSRTARVLGLSDTGVLAPGRRADLLVAPADPRTDVEALGRPELVVAAGRPYPA